MNYIMNQMTIKEFEEAMKHTKTAVLPIGVVEQHGYHLPLGTDTIRADSFAKRAAPNMNAVVFPTVAYCYSGGELPGTINISPSVFSILISDIILEAARLGFLNVVIFLGHGGTDNRLALEGAIKSVLKRHANLRRMTISIVSASRISAICRKYADMEPEHDYHAGIIETSAMMHLRPELVKMDQLKTDEEPVLRAMRKDPDYYEKMEKTVDHPFVVANAFQRPEVKLGVMGFPEQADPKLGEKLTQEVVQGLAEYVNYIDATNR